MNGIPMPGGLLVAFPQRVCGQAPTLTEAFVDEPQEECPWSDRPWAEHPRAYRVERR